MSDVQKLRRTWRTNWFSRIQEFADEETQRRWLDPANTNPHFSYVEYLCCYFDDLGLSGDSYDQAVNEGLVSKEEAAAVAQFHQLARNYNSPSGDHDHEAILGDPKWMEIVKAAQRAQAKLLCLVHDQHERSHLTKP